MSIMCAISTERSNVEGGVGRRRRGWGAWAFERAAKCFSICSNHREAVVQSCLRE
jgi:hypothetical protein